MRTGRLGGIVCGMYAVLMFMLWTAMTAHALSLDNGVMRLELDDRSGRIVELASAGGDGEAWSSRAG